MKKPAKGSVTRTTRTRATKPKAPKVDHVAEFFDRLKRTAPPPKTATKHQGKLTNPFEQGVTFSSLCLFGIDKDAYHAAYCNGWTPEKPGDGLKFGTLFHELIDRYDGKDGIPTTAQCLLDLEPRRSVLLSKVCSQQDADQIDTMVGFAAAMFPTYLNFWHNPTNSVFPGNLTDEHIEWFGREEKFRILHPGVPGRPPIPINGKRDGRFRFASPYSKKAPDVRQVLLETKTSSRPLSKTEYDATCHTFAQVNIYCLAMLLDDRVGELPSHVCYNIIRRPQLERRKGRPTKANGMVAVPETIPDFIERVREDVESRPDFYFIRSFRPFPEDQLRQFVLYELNPILREVVQHWDSIQSDPTNPYLTVNPDTGRKAVNPYHRSRFKGIFDPEAVGLHKNLFDPMQSHSRAGFVVRDFSFPELEDE